jgi:hypothetical protein
MADIMPETPVRGSLCFVDAHLPRRGTHSFNGYPLLRVKPLAKRIKRQRPTQRRRG